MGIPLIHVTAGHPDFLDLPWGTSVGEWEHARMVTMPTGIHRHPVAFVAYEEDIYAIKELSRRLATKEFHVLKSLETRTHRAAEPAGLVERDWLDPHDEASAAVITRFVRHAFPYRRLVIGPGFGDRRDQMLDALAGLLVELHTVGCYWGDCSLSNVLYRFDAGEIEAIMIDGETSEIHESLTTGQRRQDLDIMIENIAGDMADIAAMESGTLDHADLELGDDIARRYHALWDELTADLVVTRDEAYKIRERIWRINKLGFSVHDIDLSPAGEAEVVRMNTRVGGRTFNSQKLRDLTGVEAAENQARLLLGDLNYYLAKRGFTSATAKTAGAFGWLTDSYEPITSRIREVWPGDDPVQGYCDFLNHRFQLAKARGFDVDNEDAFQSWQAAEFPGFDPADRSGLGL